MPMPTRLPGQLLLLTLFFALPCRQVDSAELTPTHKELIAMADAQVGERWYGIYVMGKKVGWQRDAWEKKEGLYCNQVEFFLQMAFLGVTSKIRMEEKGCFSAEPDFGLVTYSSSRDDDGKTVTVQGQREGEKIGYRIETGEQSRTMEVPADTDNLSCTIPWSPLARMKPDDVINSHTFEELTGEKRWQRITMKTREEKAVFGKPQTIYKLLVEDEQGLSLDALVTAEGVVLEGSLGPNLRIVLEDKETARRMDVALLDLYSSSFVPATGNIDYKRTAAVKRLKLKLTGARALEPAPNRRQNILEKGKKHVVLEVLACPAAAPEPADETYTSCNADVPCDVDEFVKRAAEITGTAKTAEEKALAISGWVHKKFKYALGAGGGTGDHILKEKRGDCTEFSKAMVVLARAAGLPTRQISGVVLASGDPASFGYHAWVEAWLPDRGWTAFDPTWGIHPVDATHIVFDVDQGLQMAAHMGELTVEILEVDYAADKTAGLKCE